MMNRTDGLVQRRRVVNSSSSSGLGQDGSNDIGHNDKLSGHTDTDSSMQKDLNSNPTIDDDSDKETRLTLMEEVLLLGLKDKEVCLHHSSLFFQFFVNIFFKYTLLYRDILPFGMIA